MRIVAIILLIICILLIIILKRIKTAARDLARQADDMIGESTNQLLRNTEGIKLFVPMIDSVNGRIEELRNKARDAERMNREIRESLTEISHDLRTPLTAASGYTGMLKNMELTEDEKKRYIEAIEERFETSRNLVDQLFYYTRMESGALELQREETDIRRILTDMLAVFYSDFEKRGFEMQVDIDEAPLIVEGDSDAFKRIFSNIISNGLKHGEGSFKLSLRKETPDPKCRFEFSNRATNISKEDAGRLFDRYFTKDHVRSSSNTGLGLAIAKKLTEKMNGTCKAELVDEILVITIEFLLK